MPTFRITSPDGKTYNVSGPPGSTAQDALRQVQAQAKRQPSVTDIAKRKVEKREKLRGGRGWFNDISDASQAGMANFLGIGPHISAGVNYLGDVITGKPADYSRELEVAREVNRLEREKSPAAAFVGELFGGGYGGSLAAKGIAKGAEKLATSGTPAVARIGRALQSATTAEKAALGQKLTAGQKVRNIARISGAGAVGGGAQALGEGSDVSTGATTGAIAAPALTGVVKAAGGVGRAVTRRFGGNIPKAVQEIVTEPVDAINARWAQMTRDAGRPVPLVAALNPRDAKAVKETLASHSPETAAQVKGFARQAVRELPENILGHVNVAGAAGHAPDINLSDLATGRKNAMDAAMKQIGQQKVDVSQAGAVMNDLERQAIADAARRIKTIEPGTFQAAKMPEGFSTTNPLTGETGTNVSNWWERPTALTLRQIEDMRQYLGGLIKSPSTPGENAQIYKNARDALVGLAKKTHAPYGTALARYARQGDRISGYKLAQGGNRAEDLGDTLKIANVTSGAGRGGQRAGELARLQEQATSTPSSATSLTRQLASEGGLTRPQLPGGPAGSVTERFGEVATGPLRRAAQAENDVIEALLRQAGVDPSTVKPEQLNDPAFLTYVGSVMSGPTLAGIQARTAAMILDRLKLRPDVAQNATRMLFDPTQAQRAIAALRKAGMSSDDLSNILRNSLVTGAMSAPENENRSIAESEPIPDMEIPGEDIPQFEADQPQDNLYDEFGNPQDIQSDDQTWNAMIQQESGGNHFDEQGNPIQSGAGAIGIAQVMPATAPEAAAAAGLPYDEEAYRTDPEYNQAIGNAYFNKLRQTFQDDVLAVAAYNAGPGAVQRAVEKGGQNWLAYLPNETQDYVMKVFSR